MSKLNFKAQAEDVITFYKGIQMNDDLWTMLQDQVEQSLRVSFAWGEWNCANEQIRKMYKKLEELKK